MFTGPRAATWRCAVAAAAAVVTVGCGTAPDPDAVASADLTVPYGCGYGFHLGSADQDVHLAISPDRETAEAELPIAEIELPDAAWTAEVRLGTDLFATWCDDVIRPEDPTPSVTARWPVTGGRVVLDGDPPPACGDGPYRARVEGLEVTPPDGDPIALGDLDLINEAWGCFAG